MAIPDSIFEQLEKLAQEMGVEKTLDFLEHHFRKEKEYFQLFEVLKMRCRNRLGLPLVYGQEPDDLQPEQQNQLENCLLEACRDVGSLLIKSGRLQEGWMYLQPIGDRNFTSKLIQTVTPDEENIDTIIEIAVSQGAAPSYGYGLLLGHYGTCNAITTFDTQAARFDRPTQKEMAHLLLGHLYNELCTNLKHCIEQNGKQYSGPNDLAEILRQHPWLKEDGAHHIDTTHLASVVRIARIVETESDLKKAIELADYGAGLHADFQYPSPPPFEDTYPDHQAFFQCLTGVRQDEAISRFKRKCQSVDSVQYGPVAYETLAELLFRIGRNREAIEVLTEDTVLKHEAMGIAPAILEIAKSSEELAKVQQFYRTNEDLLGFATAVLTDRNRN